MLPIAAVDSLGVIAALGTLLATIFGSIAAFVKARSQSDSEETKSIIEVNEDLRRELKRRKTESHDLRNENQELHVEIETQRGEIHGLEDRVTAQRAEINSLQERVAGLRSQVEQLESDLARALRNAGG